MAHVKENVKGCEFSHKIRVCAVPEVEDGVQGVIQVRAGGVHSDGDGALPPLQQGLQVVHEAEVPVRGVGYALVAIEHLLSSHVIIEDPVLVSHALIVKKIVMWELFESHTN